MITTHSLLAISCICITQNLFEGAIQQIICYTAVIMYILMIQAIVKEFFFIPSFETIRKNRD